MVARKGRWKLPSPGGVSGKVVVRGPGRAGALLSLHNPVSPTSGEIRALQELKFRDLHRYGCSRDLRQPESGTGVPHRRESAGGTRGAWASQKSLELQQSQYLAERQIPAALVVVFTV